MSALPAQYNRAGVWEGVWSHPKIQKAQMKPSLFGLVAAAAISTAPNATTPPPVVNAFDRMMRANGKRKAVAIDDDDETNEKVVTVMAVIYIRWLRWIDPSEPLHNTPYIGQAVRGGYDDPRKLGEARWKEENSQAKREDKEVGLIAALDTFGEDAFFDEVVEWRIGPREDVAAWANEREVALIAEHGGPLRNPTKKLQQTLNLTKGGQRKRQF